MARISTLADIQEIEQTPLAERQLPPNTYAMIQQGAKLGLDRPALSFFIQAKGDAFQRTESYSYGDLLNNIRQTANMLRSLGVTEGEAVSMVLPNLPETHFTIWGGEVAGIVNPINPLLEAGQIKEILNAAQTRVLVTLSPFPRLDFWEKIDSIRAEVPSLKTILRINLEDHLSGLTPWVIKALTWAKRRVKSVAGQQVLDFNAYRKRFPTEQLSFERDIKPGDIASYFHTGGTTGTPKLAQHTHENEVFDAWAMLAAGDLASPDKVFFCGLPLFHVNAVIVTGLAPFGAGGHVVLATPAGYRGEGVIPNFWRIAEHFKVSFFSGVPTVYSALLNVPIAGASLESLEFAICGAAPMPVEVFRNFEKKTGVKIVEGYGCTEGTCASSVNPLYGECRIGSVGFPFPYQELQSIVLDEQGNFERIAASNEIGHVCIRGANVFPGYKESVHNQHIWVDTGDGKGSFYNTGDLGRIDADGYLWLTGRKKELIIRGGHNIDPKLIEDPLTRHPAIEMVAAVGRPDPRVGEVPVAYVKLKAGQSASKEDILSFAQTEIQERAAIPKAIHLVEDLPLTPIGKIFKPTLTYWEVESAYRQAINQIPNLAEINIKVGPDKVHGTLAQVQVRGSESSKATAIGAEINRILGDFAVKYELEVLE